MTALADDGAPTPPPESPTVETSAPTGGTESVSTEAAAADAPSNPTDSVSADSATEVPTNPTEDVTTGAAATDATVDPTTTADVSTPVPAEPTAEVVAALNDAGAVLLDENGNSVPMGSQQAADVLVNSDPYFFDGTNTVGYTTIGGSCAAIVTPGHCNHSNTPLQDAITAAPSGTTISVEQGFYNEDVTIAKQVVLLGLGTGATANSFTLNSGANVTGSSNIFAPVVNVNNGAKVQNGVDLAAAGGTVNVGTGNYREQVVINGKNITLQASGPNAVIESPDTVPTCFTTSATHKPIVCVKNASNVIIKGLTIDGRGMADQNGNNRFDGIGYFNSGGTVQGNAIEKIRDPSLSGIQDGVGLYVYNQDGISRTINVFSNNIFDYQKNGMALSGNGLTAIVQNNTVTGAGATPLTAQNGIQLSYGAVGTVSGNTVTGNFWMGTYGGSNDPITDPNSDGAAGILLYQPGAGTIQIFGNTVQGNQFGIASIDSANVNIHDNTIEGIAHTGHGYPAGILLQGSTGFSSNGSIQNNTITVNDYGVLAFNTPNIGIHNNSIINNTIYGVWSDKRLDATNNWWGDASGPLDNSAVPDVCGVLLTNPTGTGTKASTCVLYNPWLLTNPFASIVTLPPADGEGDSGRGQTQSSTSNLVVPVTGGQETTISCDSQSVTIKIEDIKVTLTALCGYDVVLEKISKDNLPGALGQGNNLEDGVLIKILKGGKVIDTLPVDASLSVAYPKPANSDTSVLTWNGSGWQEQVSYTNGNDIVTDLTAPSTLVLVTH